MKIASAHDQLYEFGGAERVFITLCQMFPDAPIYTAFYNRNRIKKYAPEISGRKIKASFIQWMPFIEKLYSPLRFLAPKIWESFDFSKYDLVISSSGWFMCKGVKTINNRQLAINNKAIHISYIHHPPRYLYGYETAMEWQKYWPIKIYGTIINHYLRMWDYESSQRPDYLIANSEETKRRIKKFYRRDSMVIYPPVIINQKSKIKNQNDKLKFKNYYITVYRLQKAKHIEILIQVANKMKFNLKIVGVGKDEKYLKSIAGPTVEFCGRVNDQDLSKLYQGAKAFLFASVDEEFGIAPIEAMGYGVPVIAYASGGLLETVKNDFNGYLFDKLTVDSLIEKIKKLEKLTEKEYLRMCQNASKESEKYSEENFKIKILEFINRHSGKRV